MFHILLFPNQIVFVFFFTFTYWAWNVREQVVQRKNKNKNRKTIFCKFSGATNWKQKYPKLAQIIIEKRFVFDSNCPNCYDYLWIEFFKMFAWNMKLEHCHDWREKNYFICLIISIYHDCALCFLCLWIMINMKSNSIRIVDEKDLFDKKCKRSNYAFCSWLFFFLIFSLITTKSDICKWKWKFVSSSSFLKLGFNQFLHIGIK